MKDIWNAYKRTFHQHAATQVTSLATLTLSFSILFASYTLVYNFDLIFSGWGDESEISVYLSEKITPIEKNGVELSLKNMQDVKDIRFVSGEKAFEEFQAELKQIAPEVVQDAEFENPFPASFIVKLANPIRRTEDFLKLKQKAEATRSLAGVTEVSFGQNWLENFTTAFQSIQSVIGFVGLALLLGCLFVVSNSIRASISQRKEEIEIYELVGATQSMLRRPYLFEGVFVSLISSTLAVSFVSLLFFGARLYLSQQASLFRIVKVIEFPNATLILFWLLFSAFFGLLSSYTVVRKINTGFASANGLNG